MCLFSPLPSNVSQLLGKSSEEFTPQRKRDSIESSDSVLSGRIQSAKRIKTEECKDEYSQDDDEAIMPPPKTQAGRLKKR